MALNRPSHACFWLCITSGICLPAVLLTQKGTTKRIEWRSVLVSDQDNVRIELLRGGFLQLTIAESRLNDGKHWWEIPDIAAPVIASNPRCGDERRRPGQPR